MRAIDADALKERIKRFLGIKSFDNLLPAEKAIVQQIDHMPTIQPEQHWIPCGERLPERSVNVLAYIDYCEVIEILSLETDGQGMLYWEDASGDYESLNDVKAWMPLPKPWEGDAE